MYLYYMCSYIYVQYLSLSLYPSLSLSLSLSYPHYYSLSSMVFTLTLFPPPPPDPYAVVSFNRHSMKSRVVKETLCPMLDQTLIFENVNFFGNTVVIKESPPPVVLEFYDEEVGDQ